MPNGFQQFDIFAVFLSRAVGVLLLQGHVQGIFLALGIPPVDVDDVAQPLEGKKGDADAFISWKISTTPIYPAP